MGTSTNLVVHGMLLDFDLEGFSLFQLAIVGIPITIVGFLYLLTVGYQLLPSNRGFRDQIQSDTKEYMAEMTVKKEFPHVNKSVQEAGLRELKAYI